MTNPCECVAAGYCPRHKFEKGQYLFELCQSRADYRELWDRRATTMILCSNWRSAGNFVFVCPRCGRSAMAPSASQLPQRECFLPGTVDRPAAAVIAPTIKGGAGCCGGVPNRSSIVEAPEPTIGEKLHSFTEAMADFVADPRLADAQSRLEICSRCNQLDGHTCKTCGCYVPLKVRAAAWHCPLAKWPGDETGWVPSVHANLVAATLVVIASRGNKHPPLLNQCGAAAVFHRNDERSWGDKCNEGMLEALVQQAKYIVLLNDDVQLSPGFFDGLIVAQRVTGAAAVAASMNVGWEGQRPRDGYAGAASEYQPNPFHKWSGYCDGTAVLLTIESLQAIGQFDLTVSPRYGWGLMTDWCVRAKRQGYRIAVTEAAYVYHENMQTAQRVFGSIENYLVGAVAERDAGLRNKWGSEVERTAEAVDLPKNRAPTKAVTAIRIRRADAMGDVICAAGVCRALKLKHPAARIVFETSHPEWLHRHPWIDETLSYRQRPLAVHEHLIELDVAYERQPKRPMLDVYAEVADVDVGDYRLFFHWEPYHGLPERYIVVHAGHSSWVGRNWTDRGYSELIRAIIAAGWSVVLVGRDSRALDTGAAIDLRHKTGLHQLGGVIHGAAAYIGADSGPFWIAQALGVPCVAFFGSIRPETRLLNGNRGVTARGLECLGCHQDRPPPVFGTRTCRRGDLACERGVTPEMMFAALDHLLVQATPLDQITLNRGP